MFLKRVNKNWFKNISISKRITFYYACITLVLLTVILGFLHWAMMNVLYKMDYHFLINESEIVKKLLVVNSTNQSILKREIEEIPLQLRGSIYRYYIRIINEKNQVVFQTPGMDDHLKKQGYSIKNVNELKTVAHPWFFQTQKNYLLTESMVFIPTQQAHWKVQTSLDLSYQHHLVHEYCDDILLAFSIGGLFAVIIGYMIAQRNMRSLDDLTQAVKTITATSLHQRIDPKLWPKELRTLGMAFNQMLSRMEESFSRVKQFSDDLAHELRTPIHNMKGEIEVLLSKLKHCSKEQAVLQSCLEEINRIQQIIENLLFLARAENPLLDTPKEILNVAAEISVIHDFYEALAAEKNITILSQGQAVVYANKMMFRRVLSNLLANALKHTPKYGQVEFAVQENDTHVQITVTDNGVGISHEHLPKLFDRFYRVDIALQGFGLGLAIVKSIMDLHRGCVSVVSTPNVGTEFTLLFPK